jgi:hypothetical protein
MGAGCLGAGCLLEVSDAIGIGMPVVLLDQDDQLRHFRDELRAVRARRRLAGAPIGYGRTSWCRSLT